MSLRSTAAVGAATLVAGATFAATAFANDGLQPDAALNAAAPDTETEEPQDTDTDAESSEEDFFDASDELTEDELAELRAQAGERRDSVLGGGVQSGSIEGSNVEEETEDDEEDDDSGSSDPGFSGDPKEYALQVVESEGWGSEEFDNCLEPLWERESNWDHTAENSSSGAYGIPQSLPGDKMASHGDDWATNPATQIDWGIDYIKDRYNTPCAAWEHSEANGWY
ncbi:lytic transglycosylase domain-containing protein [Nocardiopsis sp. HNM0947]|uniref:Lytic transglycosylase domain-containing protein n=1 Tax=Nocardiopsis coralli TaxID=2772213 RepID=A0ABR9P8S3_9ACTN|nr:lytic transglycosylase domain-containing protein [Nocardiopsis coralli]MBE3000212.1 lytic transglycosylase domain-containing protein [Nocardiopsis coralli]